MSVKTKRILSEPEWELVPAERGSSRNRILAILLALSLAASAFAISATSLSILDAKGFNVGKQAVLPGCQTSALGTQAISGGLLGLALAGVRVSNVNSVPCAGQVIRVIARSGSTTIAQGSATVVSGTSTYNVSVTPNPLLGQLSSFAVLISPA